jgi:hypothetical protein
MNFHERKRYYLALPFILLIVFFFISMVNRPKRIHQNESSVQNNKECLYASCSSNK